MTTPGEQGHWFLRECNRCGVFKACSTHGCWPAPNGNYYGQLCKDCRVVIGNQPAPPGQIHEVEREPT